jgi:putative oxygen-independent coproporphyrinogen III oxidase
MQAKCYQRKVSRAPSQNLGLYIHFPFCAYKCGYCDFNSWVEKNTEPQHEWLEGIKAELLFWKRQKDGALANFSVDTLFMGGGTPSLLRAELWEELAQFLKAELNFSDDLEWTVEANPETVQPALLQNLSSVGVNRLSLGIQSFKEKFLRRLERGATPESNRKALAHINENWKGRWSLDLMFGLPEQTMAEWEEDLQEALSFNMKHLSAYQLTLTTQKSKSWLQGSDAELLAFFHSTREKLRDSGLFPYEISNFAAKGEESRHNLKYWKAESFLGLGPGAYSLLPATLLENSEWGGHYKNPSRMPDWINWTKSPHLKNLESRSEQIHVEELFMLGLRLENGIEKNKFPQSVSWEKLERHSHLVEQNANRIWATERGRDILDTSVLEIVRTIFQ